MVIAAEHRNPWGIVHGGVLAGLHRRRDPDSAAHAARAANEAQIAVTTDAIIHYLAPRGSARSAPTAQSQSVRTACWSASNSADRGADDRLLTVSDDDCP